MTSSPYEVWRYWCERKEERRRRRSRKPPPAPRLRGSVASRVSPPPPRTLSPRGHAIELKRFTRHVPFCPACGVDHAHTCNDVKPVERIGESWADGVIQTLYQCPVCHSILTQWQALRT